MDVAQNALITASCMDIPGVVNMYLSELFELFNNTVAHRYLLVDLMRCYFAWSSCSFFYLVLTAVGVLRVMYNLERHVKRHCSAYA